MTAERNGERESVMAVQGTDSAPAWLDSTTDWRYGTTIFVDAS
jgi:hypothetical protein